jgi:hypothetical protein
VNLRAVRIAVGFDRRVVLEMHRYPSRVNMPVVIQSQKRKK